MNEAWPAQHGTYDLFRHPAYVQRSRDFNSGRMYGAVCSAQLSTDGSYGADVSRGLVHVQGTDLEWS